MHPRMRFVLLAALICVTGLITVAYAVLGTNRTNPAPLVALITFSSSMRNATFQEVTSLLEQSSLTQDAVLQYGEDRITWRWSPTVARKLGIRPVLLEDNFIAFSDNRV